LAAVESLRRGPARRRGWRCSPSRRTPPPGGPAAFTGPMGREFGVGVAVAARHGGAVSWPGAHRGRARPGRTAWPGPVLSSPRPAGSRGHVPGAGRAPPCYWQAGRSFAPPRTRPRSWRTPAHSLRLAAGTGGGRALAHQEAAALRRSRGNCRRGFLSRMSHELRTPLTAIRGYASSLMQPDVTWDTDSQMRFLDRIAAESARLGRLGGGPTRLFRDRVGPSWRPAAGTGATSRWSWRRPIAWPCRRPDAAAVSMDSRPGLPAVVGRPRQDGAGVS